MITLQTPRLTLRDYRTEDWPQVHIYGSDPEFSQFESWGPNTLDDTQKFVNDMVLQASLPDRHKFDLAICLNKSGLLIGGCGIRRDVPAGPTANLGWAITPTCQGKGYATEAAGGLIRFGFETLGLELIYATCDVRNLASARVMEKLGMRRVALLMGERIQKGQLRDTLRYEITNPRG